MESPRIGLHVKVGSADTSVGSLSPSWVLKSRENATKPRENVFPSLSFCHFYVWAGGTLVLSSQHSQSSAGTPGAAWNSQNFSQGHPGKEQRLHPVFIPGPGIPRDHPLGGTDSRQIPEQFQAGAAPAPSVLVPSAGPCPCSIQLGKIGNCSS